jgi:hypothetical protein
MKIFKIQLYKEMLLMQVISLKHQDPISFIKSLSNDQREEFMECFQCELEDRLGLPIEAIADMIELS